MYQHANLHLGGNIKSIHILNGITFPYVICEKKLTSD